MTLNESVGLVMHAFSEGLTGDIFVQKSPACTLADLAKALKNSGKYKLFFIVDDDPNLWNRNLGGIKIYSLEKLINFKKEISKVS